MSNWIDVNKQLPEEGVRVLAYHADGEQWIMVYSLDHGWRCPLEDWGTDVTHWQPLPAAPKTLNLDLVKLAKEPGKRSYAAGVQIVRDLINVIP